jgi:hypothetical protein
MAGDQTFTLPVQAVTGITPRDDEYGRFDVELVITAAYMTDFTEAVLAAAADEEPTGPLLRVLRVVR